MSPSSDRNTTGNPPARRIYALARILAVATTIAMVLLPLLTALVWAAALVGTLPQWLAMEHFSGTAVPVDLATTSPWAKLLALSVEMVGALILVYGLSGLRRTFVESAEGRWFSASSIDGFRRFAWVSLAMVFVDIVQQSALSVIMSVGTPGVQNQLSISFGSLDLAKLFTALLFVFVAQVFVAGKAIDDENAAFI
ncbi:DUF2975 domain-containing protein [Nitratireductor sp. XY-223]|uniref:DUF2975 domain-containing protein n=1 Tax=Nitratireductor sp. XY-223 TaxID=2561926 RepID=UPI0010A9F23F|nr:DUF2975 domain-containing protein [Nitratireductor sp. XY-223]